MKPLTADDALPRHFESAARLHPDRPAAILQSGSVTYAALNEAANRMAHRLMEHGQVGDRVAFLVPYGVPLIVTVLAGLKAGRMIVALDPQEPVERLAALLADSSPTTLVADEQYRALAGAIGSDEIDIVDPQSTFDGFPSSNPDLEIAAEADALLLFTSGSTGKPKGIVRSHGHIVSRATALADRMDMTPADRFVALKSLWGGQGLAWLFIPILRGAAFVPFPATQVGVTGLSQWLLAQKATILSTASSLLRHFMKTLEPDATFPDVRIVRTSADAASKSDYQAFRQHFPNAEFAVSMGSSEAGTITFARMSEMPSGDDSLPVGMPLAGVDVQIVDENGDACPPGARGALTIRSRFLASRYWKNPELTRRTFKDCGDGTRLFKSNDIASIDANGVVRLAGRNDDTFKVRGHRVDLGEVEAVLAKLPGIEEVCAIVAPRTNGEPQLVCFFIGNPTVPPDPARLRATARIRLPGHLIPSAFFSVEQLPRSPNGKVDRGQLRELAFAQPVAEGTPGTTDTEKLLVLLWSEAFDQEGIGRDDDFFALGGDSLIAAVIAARVHAETGVQVRFRDLIEHPTLHDLAGEIDRKLTSPGGGDNGPPLQPMPRNGPIRLSPAQEGLWETSRATFHAQRGIKTVPTRLTGPLDVDVLRSSLTAVVARHEILRTRFAVVDDQPVQIVDPPSDVELSVRDLPESDDPESAMAAIAYEESLRIFDLTAAPPIRFILYRVSADDHFLLRSCHHIISDGPSWAVFLADLTEFYDARVDNRPPNLPPARLQFADFSIWQREVWRKDGHLFQEAVSWWKDRIASYPADNTPRLLPPYLRKKPADPSESKQGDFFWGIDSETALRLDQLGREEMATYYVTRFAGVSPVLAAVLNTDALPLGVVFTHRGRHELRNVMGPLINLVPLMVECNWSGTFREHLSYVRQLVLEAHDQSGLPFEWLTAELTSQGVKVPKTVAWFHVASSKPATTFSGITVADADPAEFRSKALIVSVNQHNEQRRCSIGFDRRLYALDSMKDFAARMQRFMAAAARAPDTSLDELASTSGIRMNPDQPDARFG